jgi:predicted ABC-type ATPase
MIDIKTKFNNLKNTLFKHAKVNKPIFIIAFGPSGSGKTTILNKLLKHNKYQETDFVNILTDQIIETDEDYIKEVKEEHAKFTNKEITKEKLVDNIQLIYYKYRKIADILAELLIDIAARQKYNIIFETTGSNSAINWILYMINSFKERGYEIWIYYPYVLSNEIFVRSDKRAEKSYRYIPHILLQKYISEAQKNFIKLYDKVDKVWIIDNNKKTDKMDIIYQSIIEYHPDTGQVYKQQCNLQNYNLEEELKKQLEKICSKFD